MAKGKHSTALFEVINRPARTGVAPPPVVSRAPLSVGGGVQAPGAGAPGSSGPAAVQLDPDRHQISVRVSYTSALVTLFAVVVVVVLAYMVGRGVGRGPQLASASTEELRKGPANPAVMDVGAPAGAGGGGSVAGGARAAAPARQVVNNVAAAPVAASGPVAAPTNVRRTNGVNYVIMQSYPDEATAKEAQGVLLSNGIACTVEKGPQGWVPMSWYSVIGTQSFDRVTHNPQLEAYVKAIEGVKYGEKSKFKKFEPRAYRWK